jgi:hypothetical protein
VDAVIVNQAVPLGSGRYLHLLSNMASPHSEAAQHHDGQSENTGGKDTQIQQTIHHLDQANLELEAKEKLLNNALRKLKEDESCMREAIKEESPLSRRHKTLPDAEAVRTRTGPGAVVAKRATAGVVEGMLMTLRACVQIWG